MLFDLDHTLFDFDTSKRAALAEVLAEVGEADDGQHAATLSEIESPLWRQLEAGELTLETLNDARFAGFVEVAGIDADPRAMAARYLYWLGRSGGLLRGARDVLDALLGELALGLISNGYSEVQRVRLERHDLGRYFDAVVISSEIGIAKPDPAFFEHALQALEIADPSGVLVVGDSLSSDIAGAAAAGLASCWYNPNGQVRPAGSATPDHEVATLEDVLAVLRE